MSVEIETVYKVTYSGTAKWDVDSKSLVYVEGKAFVKLARSSTGFCKLVWHGCGQLPDPLPKEYSLTCSKGYVELTGIRNKLQSDYMIEKGQEALPELFKGKASPSKSRVSRSDVRTMRANPDTLELPVELNDCNVVVQALRPVHPRDDLTVEFTSEALHAIIEYLQSKGFRSDQARRKRRDTPLGVWVRRSKSGQELYVKKHRCSDGTAKFRTFKSLEDANAIIDEELASEAEPVEADDPLLAVEADDPLLVDKPSEPDVAHEPLVADVAEEPPLAADVVDEPLVADGPLTAHVDGEQLEASAQQVQGRGRGRSRKQPAPPADSKKGLIMKLLMKPGPQPSVDNTA